MEKTAFGATGFDVSILGQGSWNIEKANRRQITEAMHRGIELGMNHIDTAEMYGAGKVESVLSEILKGLRDRVFLVSKVLPENASYQGTIAACEASLRRLKTDRLDSYLLHWHEQHPLEETFRAFEKLQSDGKILSFGVSNFERAELEKAVKLAGENKIACNQVEYFLQNRGIEKDLIPYCEAHRISVVAYSPFGDHRFPGALSKAGRTLKNIGHEYGVSARCVALRFLIQKGNVAVIPKAAKLKHVEDNFKATTLKLDDDTMMQIDKMFA
jgi:diketogulonate reductase-like aldo/keto reductase